MTQTIWYKDELPIADELLAMAPKLLEEFLAYHTDFDTTFSKCKTYAETNSNAYVKDSEKNAWRTDGLKYALPDKHVEMNFYKDPSVRARFPTATALTEKYASECGCSGYSILDAGGVIERHTDIENRSRRTVRIHIPLIIPEGDTFFEVDGVEVDWTNIFAFDNESLHSAHNYTDKRRLIYIIDLSRSLMGLPEAKPFTPTPVLPFVRKK